MALPRGEQPRGDPPGDPHRLVRAVINPLIHAEVPAGYQAIEEPEELLPRATTSASRCPTRQASPREGVPAHGRGGIGGKRPPMLDFHIGAHAALAGYRLLTRGARWHQTCFPVTEIIAPPSSSDDAAR